MSRSTVHTETLRRAAAAIGGEAALAKALGVPAEKIHLKAKTNEGVDAVGRGEAIACHVAATVIARG